MSNEKFTQGEWEVEEKSASLNGLTWFGFQVISPEIRKRVCYSETDDEKNIPEMQANTNLIAAAPEMYECICDALSDLEMPDGMRNHFEAVLMKARGEE